MDNFNIDKNTIDKLNSMLNNGNLTDMLSQIPPDALNNFSNMINNSQKINDTENPVSIHTNSSDIPSNSESINSNIINSNTQSNENFQNDFDFSQIDMQRLMQIMSSIGKMNQTSDPRKNLLQSLKPYLREEKKEKLNQYTNLLNVASIVDFLNQNNNKENLDDK